MNETISKLEQRNKDSEAANARLHEENTRFEDYIEGINTATAESDNQIKSLEAALDAAQHDLKRTKTLAARTESLEEQLEVLETEQAILQDELATSKEDGRLTAERWHATQRTVLELEAQVEAIERDARQDRQKHGETVERLERKVTVDTHLTTNSSRTSDYSSQVVSTIVKDLLQDNATLQTRNEELEGMLRRANEREPLDEEPVVLSHHKSLSEELGESVLSMSPCSCVPSTIFERASEPEEGVPSRPTTSDSWPAGSPPVLPSLRIALRSKPSLAQLEGGYKPASAGANLGGQHPPLNDLLRKSLGPEKAERKPAADRYAPLRDTLGGRWWRGG